jgi:hypothetical protein
LSLLLERIIVPHNKDMRRRFEECKTGHRNASHEHDRDEFEFEGALSKLRLDSAGNSDDTAPVKPYVNALGKWEVAEDVVDGEC